LALRCSLADKTEALVFPAEESAAKEAAQAADVKAFISFDGAFTYIMHPDISFADALRAALFSEPGEGGLAGRRFELTRGSIARALDAGFSMTGSKEDNPLSFPDFIESLSGRPLDQNLRYSLEDWANRWNQVSLQTGTILTLAPEKQFLAEVRSVRRLLSRKLADGVYLLRGDKDEAYKALEKAGVDVIGRPAGEATHGGFGVDTFMGSGLPPLRHLGSTESVLTEKTPLNNTEETPQDTDAKNAADALLESFRAEMEKSNPDAAQKEALEDLLSRHLVYSPSQLAIKQGPRLRTEARSMDFAGKIAVAKQAQTENSPVEIYLPGKEEPLLGFVKSVSKAGREAFIHLDDGTKLSEVSCGKISLIRKTPQSIFES
jgi:hypothetical protein